MRLERNEIRIILLLACIQFTHTVDFVLMMPLAPLFMKEFGIGPHEFSLLVASYTWSSSIFGLISAFFVDRFDRKRVLLTSYFGFIVGTALCAASTSTAMLLLARTAAGAFAGLMISSVFSIVADIVPEVRRGTALGTVMAAFPVASVLGVPFSVYLANAFNWHTPFIVLVALSLVVLLVMIFLIPPVREHLKVVSTESSWVRMTHFLRHSRYYPSMLFAFLLMLAAFTVIPFIGAYLNANVGIPSEKLYLVYLCGGACTFFTSQFFGRLSDRYGKLKVFRVLALASILPIILITNLQTVPLLVAIASTTIFMVLVSGRFVPAMALITGSVEPNRRGAYMSFSTSIQHMGSGLSSYMGGLILVAGPDGRLMHFEKIGYLAVVATLICLWLSGRMTGARLN